MSLLLGMGIGAVLTLGLVAYLERPVKRAAPKRVGAQWTPEAAASLVAAWASRRPS